MSGLALAVLVVIVVLLVRLVDVLVDVLVVHYLKGYVELLREPTSVIEVLE